MIENKKVEFMVMNMRTVMLLLVLSAGTIGTAYGQSCFPTQTPGLMAYNVGVYTVLAYVPESAIGHAAPLVVNLHPSGGTGLRTLNESKHVADRNGFVMVAPTGVVGPVFGGWTWNVPGVPTFGGDNYPDKDVRDDVKFISRVINGAEKATCIDENRVYVMGFSGGGRMASQLACDLSDRIASVVAIGGIRFPKASDTEYGLPNAVECEPSNAVSMQAIHGRWDPTNVWYTKELGKSPLKAPGVDTYVDAPVEGSSWSYSGEVALDRWVKYYDCATEPRITAIADGVERRDYLDCRGGADVSLVFFDNLGHAVPGYEEPGDGDGGLDGYALAWELLKDDKLH